LKNIRLNNVDKTLLDIICVSGKSKKMRCNYFSYKTYITFYTKKHKKTINSSKLFKVTLQRRENCTRFIILLFNSLIKHALKINYHNNYTATTEHLDIYVGSLYDVDNIIIYCLRVSGKSKKNAMNLF
jgi:hypothetical protein